MMTTLNAELFYFMLVRRD